jgi:virginiamycin B lyase
MGNKLFISRRQVIVGMITTGVTLSTALGATPSAFAATLAQNPSPKRLKAAIKRKKAALTRKNYHPTTGKATLKPYTLQANKQAGLFSTQDAQATFSAYPVTTTSNPGLLDITTGDEGTGFWFTEGGANRIGKISTQGAVTDFTLPLSGYQPGAVANGPGDTFWFTYEQSGNDSRFIGRMVGASGQVTLYGLPSEIGGPTDLTRGPNDTLWFSTNNGYVGKMTTSGALTLYQVGLPYPYGIRSITAGPDGAIWFTERSNIVRITTNGEVAGGIGFEMDYGIGEITAGENNDLWYTDSGYIGHLTTSGDLTQYSANGLSPNAITRLGNGTFAFGNIPYEGTPQVGRVTSEGDIQLFDMPNGDKPIHMIYAGWANEVWLTTSNKIYKFRVTV